MKFKVVSEYYVLYFLAKMEEKERLIKPNTDKEKQKIQVTLDGYIEKIKAFKFIGYLFAALSGLCFTSSNFLVPVVIGSYIAKRIPTLEVVFGRSLVQLILIVPIILITRIKLLVTRDKIVTLIAMSLFGYLNIIATYFALDKIPLADALVITFTSPFFTAIFSLIILKEQIHWLDLVSGIISFLGVVLVARPSFLFGTDSKGKTTLFVKPSASKERREMVYLLGILYALLGGICLAIYFVLTRKISKSYSQFLSIFYPSVLGVLLTPLVMYFRNENFIVPMSVFPNTMLVFVGLTSSLALFFLTLALKMENATIVNLIRNLDVIYAFLFQYLAMSIKPNVWSVSGGSIIISATSMIVIRRSTIWNKLLERCNKKETIDMDS